jgi:hypothetical protein
MPRARRQAIAGYRDAVGVVGAGEAPSDANWRGEYAQVVLRESAPTLAADVR